jgi:HD superfamily phosphohydrolase
VEEAGERVALYRYRAVFLDSVHRFIPVNEAEYYLLQLPFYRRLHEVKQLGYVFLVFPSAKHTRFEHTLGVMHVAGRVAERLMDAEGWGLLLSRGGGKHAFVQLARIAGLLHDVGHPPYSHTLERPLEDIMRSPDDFGLDSSLLPQVDWGRHSKLHEFVGSVFSRFIADSIAREPPPGINGEDLAGLVEAAASAVFGAPLTGRARETLDELGLREEAVGVVGEIISHPFVDADRIDYLVRDAHNTGVVFGYIDLERLIHDVKVRREGDRYRIVYGPKSIPAIEDLYDARFKMYRSVYLHHKVVGLSVALLQTLRNLFSHWREALPGYILNCLPRPEYFLDPERLGECIAGGRMYWDDSEFNLAIRGLAAIGGEASRWARALGSSRDLLPVSLIKRPDRIVSLIVERVGIQQAPAAIEGALEDLRRERIVESWYEDRVGLQDVIVDVTSEKIGGSVEPTLPGGSYSFYLENSLRMAAIPLPYAYAFSHDDRTHREVARHAEGARQVVAEWLVERARELARR